MQFRVGTRGLHQYLVVSIVTNTFSGAFTFMSSVKDTSKGQVSVLSNISSDVGLVRLDFGVTSLAELVAELGLDGQAYLLTSVPFTGVSPAKTSKVVVPRLTVALIVPVAIH
jgi:hypothetical protein